MPRRLTTPIAASVATAILAAGSLYAVVRPVRYESHATVVLAPTPSNPKDVPTLLGSFTQSGTAGTYVQLLSSRDTLRLAGSPPVDITVRAIPATRSLEVKSKSRFREAVQPAIASLIAAAKRRQVELKDPWELRVLEQPSSPDEVGAGTGVILIATALLGLLGALLVFAIAGRLGVPPSRVSPRPQMGAASSRARRMRRGWRYPTKP